MAPPTDPDAEGELPLDPCPFAPADALPPRAEPATSPALDAGSPPTTPAEQPQTIALRKAACPSAE